MTGRRAAVILLAGALTAGAAAAQDRDAVDDAVSEALRLPEGTMAADDDRVEQGSGAVLRGLDKVNASVEAIPLDTGETVAYGRLSVRLRECRYPAGDPAGDAFALLTIRARERDEALFSGWMVASSPALNALEHPRYDVWVLRCTTS